MGKRLTLEQTRLQSQVKRANQRLREMEQQGFKSKAYQYIERSAFDNKQNIFGKTKKGEIKFRTDISKMTTKELKSIKNVVETYLNAKTSTISGHKKLYGKARQTFNQQYNVSLSEDEFNKVWTSSQVQQFKRMYGSQETKNVIVSAKTKGMNVDEISNFLNSFTDGHTALDEIKNSLNDEFMSDANKTSNYEEWEIKDLF